MVESLDTDCMRGEQVCLEIIKGGRGGGWMLMILNYEDNKSMF